MYVQQAFKIKTYTVAITTVTESYSLKSFVIENAHEHNA